MSTIRLVAMREYAENVKTKGFWITILIIPMILIGMFFLQLALQRAAPQRYFILIDQSGQYERAVATAVERDHQRRILQEFVSFLLENRRERNLNLEAPNPATAVDRLIDDVEADELAALDEWIESGGLQYAQVMASPYLREGIRPFEPPQPRFIAADIPPAVEVSAGPEEIVAALRPYLLGDRRVSAEGKTDELFALILIPEDVDKDISRPGNPPSQNLNAGIQYWARNLTDSRLPDAIGRAINEEIRAAEFTAAGVDGQLVRNVQRTRMPVTQLDPAAEAGEETVSLADTFRQYAPMGFVYLMFISLMQNVQYLLGNTIEEKSNRIIEVLLASVTPNELMSGKLIGIGMAGLTTITAWLLSAYLFIVTYPSTQTELMVEILDLIFGSDLVPWFVFYYFAGYALYSGVFLAIGSLCNTLKEAQALMTPMIFIQVIPIAMMAFVVMDPNNALVRALSWFPLFTPYMMMNRAAADPPLIDLVGTTLLLLMSIAAVIWLSGKVFRLGMLRTGQPPKVFELVKLLKARN